MATITTNYGSATSITCTLTSLTSTSYRQSTVVDNGTNKFVDALIFGSTQVGTSPTAGGAIEIWAYGSIDGTTYTAGCSGSDSAYTADGEEDELRFIGVVTVDTTSDQDYVWGPLPVAPAFGGILPQKWGLVFKNATGVTMHATGTNNSLKYQGIKYDVA